MKLILNEIVFQFGPIDDFTILTIQYGQMRFSLKAVIGSILGAQFVTILIFIGLNAN